MIFEMLKKDRPRILDGAVLVRADNVFEYACRHWTKESGGVDVMDFPCIRPPYKVVFVEFFVGAGWARSAGVALELLTDPAEVGHLKHTLDEGAMLKKGVNLRFPEEARYALSSVVFIEKTHDCTVLPGTKLGARNDEPYLNLLPGCSIHWFMDELGHAVPFAGTHDDAESHYIIKMGDPEFFMKDGTYKREHFEKMKDHAMNFVYVALATVSFMNCKNVVIQDHAPSRQQRRLSERTGRPPEHPYKTLLIYPMRKVRGEPRGGTHEPPALHLVRGHFKDYREGGGLGRFHARGLWWWESQVRGKYDRGTVDKDYDVRAEKEAKDA